MASVLIAKPRTRDGAVLTGGSAIGTNAGSNGFYIKLLNISQSFKTQMVEVTGDGDTDPVYDNDEQIDAQFVIDGLMTNAQALGLKNLSYTDTAGSGQELGDMIVHMSNLRTFTYASVRVRSVKIKMDVQEPFVKVRIFGVGHNTTQGGWE